MRAMILPVLVMSCLAFTAHAGTYQRNLPGGIVVTLVDGSFNASEHHIENCNQTDTCLVDHHPPLMTLGLPTVEIKSIKVSVGGLTYTLPSSRMFDPGLSRKFGGLERFAGYCVNRFNCAFRAKFAEAGGAYSAEWIIRNGVATRTVLSTSIDISTLFSKNPAPPQDEKHSLSGLYAVLSGTGQPAR
ncbi:hypothetical protein [Massilia genomosp. 1]|uniref:Uncharacterized protein n=1 Tax=Massilia genomosp. 1 TaxID=2609280 RepID=A0ABX0N4P8_9BURK|nr:hypothetical protein [Massilia genomosp. 1]NHZ66514.1 hypothetical protein [Massilia genomosp. 1]